MQVEVCDLCAVIPVPGQAYLKSPMAAGLTGGMMRGGHCGYHDDQHDGPHHLPHHGQRVQEVEPVHTERVEQGVAHEDAGVNAQHGCLAANEADNVRVPIREQERDGNDLGQTSRSLRGRQDLSTDCALRSLSFIWIAAR
jgi:hypothetical protein